MSAVRRIRVMPVLEKIPVALPAGEVVTHLRLAGHGGEDLARELLAEAAPLIQARAFYREVFIEEKGEDWVRLEGAVFKSRVLRANLERAEKFFPYVLTVGGGLEERAAHAGDLLRQYYLETIADLSLMSAGVYLERHLHTRFGFEKLSSMNPGSLEDWPITEQKPLFALLGDPEAAIGVRLNKSLLMLPRKSVSGVLFPTEESFYSCQLCARERCQGRRASFDEALRRKYENVNS
jgi:hypothetical protein